MNFSTLDECFDMLVDSNDPSFPRNTDRRSIFTAVRRIKNTVIANKKRKMELVRGWGRVASLVKIVSSSPMLSTHQSLTSPDLDMERQVLTNVVDILGSISLPQEDALMSLVTAKAHSVLITLLHTLFDSQMDFSPSPVWPLFKATLRSLKNIYSNLFKVVGPNVWGISDTVPRIYCPPKLESSSSNYHTTKTDTSIFAQNGNGATAHNNKNNNSNSNGSNYNNNNIHSNTTTNPIALSIEGLSKSARMNIPEKPSHTLDEFANPAIDLLFEGRTIYILVQIVHTAQDVIIGNDSSSASVNAKSALASEMVEMICTLIHTCTRSKSQQKSWIYTEDPQQDTDMDSNDHDDDKPSTASENSKILNSLANILYLQKSKLSTAINRALSSLLRDNESAINGIFDRHKTLLDLIISLQKDYFVPCRISACLLFTVALKAARENGFANKLSVHAHTTIQTLIRLSNEDQRSDQVDALFTLAYLISGRPDFQEMVSDLQGLTHMRKLLVSCSAPPQPYPTAEYILESARFRESFFLTVGAICFHSEEQRRAVIDAGLLPMIVEGLKDPFVGVRATACSCLRALSRSINILQTGLVDTNAALPLANLLRPDEDEKVLIPATATIANLILEISPMKRELLQASAIGSLVALTHSSSMIIKTNAILALKNAIYIESTLLKQIIMESLGWKWFTNLLKESPPASDRASKNVEDQTLSLLRNLTCSSHSDDTHYNDVSLVIQGIGETELFDVLETKLKSLRADTLVEASYCLANIIASGDFAHRDAIMNREGIMVCIRHNLSHSKYEVRVASVWCIVNILQDGHENKRMTEYVSNLRSLGVESKLREMCSDSSVDVRERVRDALECFDNNP